MQHRSSAVHHQVVLFHVLEEVSAKSAQWQDDRGHRQVPSHVAAGRQTSTACSTMVRQEHYGAAACTRETDACRPVPANAVIGAPIITLSVHP